MRTLYRLINIGAIVLAAGLLVRSCLVFSQSYLMAQSVSFNMNALSTAISVLNHLGNILLYYMLIVIGYYYGLGKKVVAKYKYLFSMLIIAVAASLIVILPFQYIVNSHVRLDYLYPLRYVLPTLVFLFVLLCIKNIYLSIINKLE